MRPQGPSLLSYDALWFKDGVCGYSCETKKVEFINLATVNEMFSVWSKIKWVQMVMGVPAKQTVGETILFIEEILIEKSAATKEMGWELWISP